MGWVTQEESAAAAVVCHVHSQQLEDLGSVHVETLGVAAVLKLKNKTNFISLLQRGLSLTTQWALCKFISTRLDCGWKIPYLWATACCNWYVFHFCHECDKTGTCGDSI